MVTEYQVALLALRQWLFYLEQWHLNLKLMDQWRLCKRHRVAHWMEVVPVGELLAKCHFPYKAMQFLHHSAFYILIFHFLIR